MWHGRPAREWTRPGWPCHAKLGHDPEGRPDKELCESRNEPTMSFRISGSAKKVPPYGANRAILMWHGPPAREWTRPGWPCHAKLSHYPEGRTGEKLCESRNEPTMSFRISGSAKKVPPYGANRAILMWHGRPARDWTRSIWPCHAKLSHDPKGGPTRTCVNQGTNPLSFLESVEVQKNCPHTGRIEPF